MAEENVDFDTNRILKQYWIDHWNEADALTIYRNDTKDETPHAPSVTFTVQFGSNRQVTVGDTSPLERGVHMVVVKIGIPIGEGDSLCLWLGGKIKTMFKRLQISVNAQGGLISFMEAPEFHFKGESKDGLFYYGVVFAPFVRDAYT